MNYYAKFFVVLGNAFISQVMILALTMGLLALIQVSI